MMKKIYDGVVVMLQVVAMVLLLVFCVSFGIGLMDMNEQNRIASERLYTDVAEESTIPDDLKRYDFELRHTYGIDYRILSEKCLRSWLSSQAIKLKVWTITGLYDTESDEVILMSFVEAFQDMIENMQE